MEKRKQGFAVMDKEQQKAIASAGGKAAHASGRAYQFTSEKAKEAGAKGAESRKRNKEGKIAALEKRHDTSLD